MVLKYFEFLGNITHIEIVKNKKGFNVGVGFITPHPDKIVEICEKYHKTLMNGRELWLKHELFKPIKN